MMETAHISEMPVNATWHHIPEEYNLHTAVRISHMCEIRIQWIDVLHMNDNRISVEIPKSNGCAGKQTTMTGDSRGIPI